MSAGALIAGNTVVYKPSPDAPTTGVKLIEILREAGLPPGAMSYLTDSGAVVGKTLVASPKVSGMVVTGSKAVGFTIVKNFNDPRPRPCFLELGGKNPSGGTENADLEKGAEGIRRGGFGFAGQSCISVQRVYVERTAYGAFLEAFVPRVEALKVGDPAAEDTDVGPLISPSERDRVLEWIEEARTSGADILTGGSLDGDLLLPTVIGNAPAGTKLSTEEAFGPVCAVWPYDTLDEAIARANGTRYGLAASIWTGDVARAHALARRLQAGVVWINCFNEFDDAAPFGGFKESGWGRDLSHHALDGFLQLKAVWTKLPE